MSFPLSSRWRPLVLACLGAILAAEAAPLSYQAALAGAESQAPQLAAQAAGIEAARAAAVPAGALPDPKLFVGIDNLPVSGTDRWRLQRDFMTMQKIGLMQEVPNAAKRQARVEAAAATLARGEAEYRLVRLAVRRDAALAWLSRYYLERQLALFDPLMLENRLLADAVRARLAGGQGMPVDVVGPAQEAAELAERRDEVERDLSMAAAALRRWLGPDADQALAGEPPDYAVDAAQLQHRLAQHPELARFGPLTAQAQAEIKEAEAGRRPDWGWEFAYQRRGPAFGDMVSLQFSVDLPLFPAGRQNPQIAAKQAALTRLAAERAALLAEHAQALTTELADYSRLSRASQRQRDALLPLAEQKLALQTASYRAGRADLAAVLAARRELIEARLKQIELDSQRAQAAARLHFNYGEQAP